MPSNTTPPTAAGAAKALNNYELLTKGNPSTQAASKALDDVIDGIETDIINGTLKPYSGKDVWIP